MRNKVLFIIALLITVNSNAQRTITGIILDGGTDERLIGANVIALGEQDTSQTISDQNGYFQLNVPSSDIQLQVSYIGYSSVLNIISSEQEEITIYMMVDESNIAVNPIIVANPFTTNDVTFNRKEFQVLPGAYEDPSRLLLKAPGFTTSNDQANYILYKGLPSNYIRWNINDAAIVNPNHLSNAGSLSDVSSANAGGVNMVSGQVLGKYEFESAPYHVPNNNAIAGTSDMEFSSFNRNYVNLSLVGLEAGLGIESKKYPNVQVNYRYSTVGILTGVLGLDFGGEKIGYQDLFAKVDFIDKQDEMFSVYAIKGISSNIHNAVDEIEKSSTFKDIQDIVFESDINVVGTKYKKRLGQYNLNAVVNYSFKQDLRQARSPEINFSSSDSLSQRLLGGVVSVDRTWSNNKLAVGLNFNSFNDKRISKVFSFQENEIGFVNTNVLPYLSIEREWQSLFLKLASGLSYNSLTENLIFEPSAKLSKTFPMGISLSAAYRRNSQLLSNTNFSYQISPEEIIGNHIDLNLDISRKKFGAFVNVFNHNISNILIDVNSNYSQFTGLDHPGLQNFDFSGKGRSSGFSYGLNLNDVLLDKLNISFNSTVFSSRFTNHQGDWINNTFDFGNANNILLSYTRNLKRDKEFVLSIAYHRRGGLREFEIDQGRSDALFKVLYDFDSLPSTRLSTYDRIDLRVVYNLRKGSSRRFAQNISLDIQNLANKENDAFNTIDFYTGEAVLQRQLGLIPVLAYRIEF